MSKYEKIILRVLRGTSDTNISFAELCQLLLHVGFAERIRGSHHIFTKDGIEEILNLQPKNDGKAKSYQVKQVRNLLIKYKLYCVQHEKPSFLSTKPTLSTQLAGVACKTLRRSKNSVFEVDLSIAGHMPMALIIMKLLTGIA